MELPNYSRIVHLDEWQTIVDKCFELSSLLIDDDSDDSVESVEYVLGKNELLFSIDTLMERFPDNPILLDTRSDFVESSLETLALKEKALTFVSPNDTEFLEGLTKEIKDLKKEIAEERLKIEEVFWNKKWESNQLGFNEEKINPLLSENFDKLQIPQGKTVFIPLCGKTIDITWFLQKGYHVIGSELSTIAIDDLFKSLGIVPQIEDRIELKVYTGPNIKIFVGNIFSIKKEDLGEVDAVYDRAAIVALPNELRKSYATHLIKLTQSAPQLVITIDHNDGYQGPPYAVPQSLLENYYGSYYKIEIIGYENFEPRMLKKMPSGKQIIWHLSPLDS
jgi:thiopurine S-methyltransferase